ncbi:MAG: fumarylacetoacetate hydrolase family protein [Pseudomonas sp.]
MGVSVVRYSSQGSSEPCWGVLKDSAIFPLMIDSNHHRDLMGLYYSDRQKFMSAVSDEGESISGVEFLSPVSQDIQLIAQGMNYASHRDEGRVLKQKKVDPGEVSLFYKASSSISKPNVTIIRPKGCKLLDYEIELGIIVKKAITEETQITDENLADYVGGLVLANDVSARDMMFGATYLQWYKGKSQRTFCPLGPVLYLLDDGEIDKIYKLQLNLRLNGVVRQNAVTGDLIHKPAKALAEISTFTNLKVGDCVLTGTPGGVIMGVNAKTGLAVVLNMNNDSKRRRLFTEAQLARATYLKPGDLLELEIKSLDGSIDLGKQTNQIADACH